MKKIKNIIAGVTAFSLLAGMTGCGGNIGSVDLTDSSVSSGEERTVSTDGSTSMESVIGFLSEAYRQKNGVKVTYNPTGSGAGIQAVQEGRCDIGLSSRELKSEEAETLNGTVIALDGIAVIVNPQNTVANMTVDQISKIYTGEITNWSQAGGDDVTGTEDKCKYNQELTSTGDVIQTVASNPNAIGYASLASVGESVKAVSVENISPSEETILSGEYPIQRGFLLVTPKDKALSETAQAFYDFCTSSEADELIRKAGAVPVAK